MPLEHTASTRPPKCERLARGPLIRQVACATIEAPMASPREIVRTESAPSAIGPYSQAVRLGGLLFLSGQIPLEPENGHLVTGSIKDQTHPVLEILYGNPCGAV